MSERPSTLCVDFIVILPNMIPAGWKRVAGRSLIYIDVELTFNEAWRVCDKFGGTLVFDDHPDVHAALSTYFEPHGENESVNCFKI